MFTDNYTDITMLLDRSGSMASIACQTVDGFEGFVAEQRSIETPGRLSLIQFDDRYERVYTERAISRVGRLKFRPRGATALFDAMGQAITETEKRLHSKPLQKRPRQVLFVTITDGLENSSREYTQQRVFELIARQRDHFDWQFVYLGANQDAIAEGQKFGIPRGCSLDYEATPDGAEHLWRKMGKAVARHRVANSPAPAESFFTEQERD